MVSNQNRFSIKISTTKPSLVDIEVLNTVVENLDTLIKLLKDVRTTDKQKVNKIKRFKV